METAPHLPLARCQPALCGGDAGWAAGAWPCFPAPCCHLLAPRCHKVCEVESAYLTSTVVKGFSKPETRASGPSVVSFQDLSVVLPTTPLPWTMRSPWPTPHYCPFGLWFSGIPLHTSLCRLKVKQKLPPLL